MFDPEDPHKIKALIESVDWSKRQKKPFEEQRLNLLRLLVGKEYGDNGSKDPRPINLIELLVHLFSQGMASHSPQAEVSSVYPDLAPYAADLELALNQQINRINLKDAFNTCAIEALFCMGVMEVGITSADTPPDGEGNLYDPGHLFADAVLFEDLILDMNAKTWDQQGYMGHDFVVPLEWVKENDNFDPNVRSKLQVGDRDGADSLEDTQSESLTRSGSGEEFEESTRLRQLFLPRQQLVLLFAIEHTQAPLQIIEWKGPEKGPYHPLALGKVPGNLIPLAPVPLLYELDDITNKSFRKAADQAERQKTIGLARSEDDAKRIMEGEDGMVVQNADPEAIKEVSFGGQNQLNLTMATYAKELFGYMAGNVDAMGGLSAGSRTVGQDQLMAQTASGRMKDMQLTMQEFQGGVFQDLAFWLWEDPVSEYHLIKPAYEGDPYGIPTTWSPENRMGRYFDYNIKANGYSAQSKSPSEEGAELMQWVQTFLLPALPMMQQEGIGVKWEALFKLMAKKFHKPEWNQLINYTNGESQPQRAPVSPHAPAATTRRYERVNRSEQGGVGDELMKAMMAGMKDSGMGLPERQAG